ncbi:hypothetical protein AruPA_17165 [Acidiphilium sp. PA]|uniref:hypothetical protein n=1 Tax=Acidiphilium sp. PA TaxID=2871705 RepID=UPI0022430B40|nr:hypothetical protein [Acidiphilium sp. PA]MCW8308767.1 hypothetical protein [Acidiphilium sp. PA]
MSDATSDVPLPRAPIAPTTETAAPRRPRKRDTILFATTALVVAGATAGVILHHRIEPVIEPLIAHVLNRKMTDIRPSSPARPMAASPVIPELSPPPAFRVGDHAVASDKARPAATSTDTIVGVAHTHTDAAKTHVMSHTMSSSGHPANLSKSTFQSILDLKSGSFPTASHKPVASRPTATGAKKSRLGESVVVPVMGDKHPATTARLAPVPVMATIPHQPVPTKSPAASSGTTASTSPTGSAVAPKVLSPAPKSAAAAVGASQLPTTPAVNALLHPIAPTMAPHVTSTPAASIAPLPMATGDTAHPHSLPIGTAGGPATLATIAHPVQTATHLVAGPLTPKSEIPVLSLVSQLGVLVAQLRNENEALAHQVATLQATTTRRLDIFSRTLHLDEAKSALALAVQPAQAPRAAIHPHIFQSHSAVPSGKISASSYRIIASSPGVAIISRDGRTDEVSVGDVVPGVGRVVSVTEDGTSWVVNTTHGQIHQ